MLSLKLKQPGLFLMLLTVPKGRSFFGCGTGIVYGL
jgi:hypothetical protein